MNITIKKGVKSDLPFALELIKELASYEKAPLEVSVSIEEMEEDGFGKNPIFEFFVAEADSKIVGIALYYIKYSTWKGKCLFLEDIIVTESFRKAGIGKKLFDEVVKVAKEMKVRRMEWQVLEWNTPAIKFYERVNSKFDNEWVNCKLNENQLENYSFNHGDTEITKTH
ncbi:MAG: N-acetyltransferase [Bacteroidota bacterium]|jgi:GNAT superfamily N-acetyltransferase|nr:N-acetyltransferase [Bacteroidota bacterium]